MTDDQRDFIVEMIRNTVEYLHKQEVLLIQLAGSIEMEKRNPEPTPAEKTAVESEEFYKNLEEERRREYKEHGFPWGHMNDKPGLTHIVSEAASVNIVEESVPTPIRDAMVHGVPIKPGEGIPITFADELPKGALE